MPFGSVVYTRNSPEIFQVELNADRFGSTDFVFQLDSPQRLSQAVATNGVHLAVVWDLPGTSTEQITIYRYPSN